VLSTWAAGVSYARILNNHQRHGDLLTMATAADFCGTRWQVNAVMIPTPGGRAYLMPVARVMQLYRLHTGTHAVSVHRVPDGLDVVASRKGDTLFLHAANTRRDRPIRAKLLVDGERIAAGRAFEIAEDPMTEVSHLNSDDVMKTAEEPLGRDAVREFSAASVTVVELKTGYVVSCLAECSHGRGAPRPDSAGCRRQLRCPSCRRDAIDVPCVKQADTPRSRQCARAPVLPPK